MLVSAPNTVCLKHSAVATSSDDFLTCWMSVAKMSQTCLQLLQDRSFSGVKYTPTTEQGGIPLFTLFILTEEGTRYSCIHNRTLMLKKKRKKKKRQSSTWKTTLDFPVVIIKSPRDLKDSHTNRNRQIWVLHILKLKLIWTYFAYESFIFTILGKLWTTIHACTQIYAFI